MQKKAILQTSKVSGKSTSSPNEIDIPFKIKSHKVFEKEVLRVPFHVQQKTFRILSRIKAEPNLLQPNTVRIKGFKNICRTRIGKYRLIFQVNHEDKIIFVLGIDTRGEVYKMLNRLLD